jgi:integrase
MEWKELNLDKNTWTIPGARTKNGKEHIVHLSAQSLSIIHSLPKNGNYVFPSSKTTTPISAFADAKEALDKLMPTETPWRIHDLRRTFVTLAGENNLADPHVIEAAVNHLSGVAKAGVAGVYNRAQYLDQRRELFNAWSDYVSGLVVPKRAPQPVAKAAKVIAFPKLG